MIQYYSTFNHQENGEYGYTSHYISEDSVNTYSQYLEHRETHGANGRLERNGTLSNSYSYNATLTDGQVKHYSSSSLQSFSMTSDKDGYSSRTYEELNGNYIQGYQFSSTESYNASFKATVTTTTETTQVGESLNNTFYFNREGAATFYKLKKEISEEYSIVEFTKNFNSYSYKDTYANTSTGIFDKIISSTSTQNDNYDFQIEAFKQESSILGGILTASFIPTNLDEWEEISEFSYEDEFVTPYEFIDPKPVPYDNTNNFEGVYNTLAPSYDEIVRTTVTTSYQTTLYENDGSKYTTTQSKLKFTITHLSDNEYTNYINSAGGQAYSFQYKTIVSVFSTYEKLEIIDNILQTIDGTFFSYITQYFTSTLSVGDQNNSFVSTSKNADAVIVGNPQVHPHVNFKLFYKQFNKMIMHFTDDSFDSEKRLFKYIFTSQLPSNETDVSVNETFKAAIPAYQVVPNVSQVIQEFYFTSTQIGIGSTSVGHTDQTYPVTFISTLLDEFNLMKTKLFTGSSYKAITTTDSIPKTFSYYFKIVSSEGDNATFAETIFDDTKSSSGLFKFFFGEEDYEKTSYKSQYLSALGRSAYFKIGGAVNEFEDQNAFVEINVGLWSYSAYDLNGYLQNNEVSEIFKYKDTPKYMSIDPEQSYVFSHKPKIKMNWYEPVTIDVIAYAGDNSPLRWIGDEVTIPTLWTNLYFEEDNRYTNFASFLPFLLENRNPNKLFSITN